ncbi:MAG: sugar phosphate isomerase/epimerase [Armatimonadetes bacterium]|nr:sugar phosphate isomerase/epimerase [Armatimonadota bacterium]
MVVGMLTAPMHDLAPEKLVDFASSAGIKALEVHAASKSAHFDPDNVDLAKRLRDIAGDAGIIISSFAAYVNISATDPAERERNQGLLARVLDICEAVGVDILCCNAGQPAEGLSREETIRQISAPFYRDFARRAADKGVRLALENWTATNMRDLSQWELMFEEVPDQNFGLNFDPSHLVWQDIDYLWAVDVFGKRIFHTHAKDTEIVAHRKAWVGNQASGWWRFVLPGLGVIDWGVYVSRLRRVGYNGVLSIEHEDSAVGREEGFRIAAQHLLQFV